MACARGVLSRKHPLKPDAWQFLRNRCKRLRCPHCGPKRAAICRDAIFRAATALLLHRLVTLTLDPGLIPADAKSVDYINQVFHRWLTILQREFPAKLTYIRVLEFQGNGTAHFHLLIKETIAQDTIIKTWVKAGGGHQVRIRYRDGNRGAAYVTKYITKDLALNVPEGRHMFSSSKGVVLFPKKLPTGWQWHNWDYDLLVHFMENAIIESTGTPETSDYFESYRDPPWEGIPDR